MIKKKSQLPVFKVIVILLTSSAIFISFIFFYFNSQDIKIDNNKAISQLIIKKILNSNCFSNKYGLIEENKFNEKNLNLCFKKFNEKIKLKLTIRDFKNKAIISKEIYLGNNKLNFKKNDEFKQKAKFCNSFSQNSNLYCSSHLLPIIYLNTNNKQLEELIEINIII